jgi:hypothetical protein
MHKAWVGFLVAIMMMGITDGEIYGSIIDSDISSLFVVDGGAIIDSFTYVHNSPDDNTTADIYGGYIGGLVASFSSTVNLYDGSIGNLHANDSSMVNIHDGRVHNLDAYQWSSVNIFGGLFENIVRTSDYSQIIILGGSFANRLRATENSIMTIYGSDFNIDGIPISYGQITVPTGILTGILASGESINNDFYIYDDATIVLVPEPATVLLFGLGSLALLKKRRI